MICCMGKFSLCNGNSRLNILCIYLGMIDAKNYIFYDRYKYYENGRICEPLPYGIKEHGQFYKSNTVSYMQ